MKDGEILTKAEENGRSGERQTLICMIFSSCSVSLLNFNYIGPFFLSLKYFLYQVLMAILAVVMTSGIGLTKFKVFDKKVHSFQQVKNLHKMLKIRNSAQKFNSPRIDRRS